MWARGRLGAGFRTMDGFDLGYAYGGDNGTCVDVLSP